MENNKTNEPTGPGAAGGAALDNFFVKPLTINLLKGGGEIPGVNEKFQVNQPRASNAQSIYIFIALGLVFDPGLALNYESG